MRTTSPILKALAFVLLLALPVTVEAGDDDALWEALRTGEAFAIMRHALAPGTSDPPGIDLDDCATQRNLSDDGRRQAAETGARFRERGIATARVFTSAWCRCKETAELLGLGPVELLEPLNSFYEHRARRDPQTNALKAWLAGDTDAAPLVLVTHQVNIRALTGKSTSSGEMVVVRKEPDGGLKVLGKL